MPADPPFGESGFRPINDLRSSLPSPSHFETSPPGHSTAPPPTSPTPPRPLARSISRPGVGIFLTIIIGFCVGAGMLLATPLQYVNGSRFIITGLNPSNDLAYFRQALQTYSWQFESSLSPAEPKRSRWYVESPAATQLSLCCDGRKGSADVLQIEAASRAFVKEINEKIDLARVKPSEQEDWLSQQTAAIQSQLEQANGKVEKALAGLKSDDPVAMRDELMARWKDNRESFSKDRQAYLRADAQLKSLQQQPLATFGVVTPTLQDEAYQGNSALQQDLDELQVHLSELKLHLLNVWQKSMPMLDELVLAGGIFSTTLSAANSSGSSLPLPALSDMANQYRSALDRFSSDWRADFATVRQRKTDSMSPQLPRLHESLRSRLGGFLFEAGKTLGSARRQVQAIADSSADDARFHVMYSDLVRTFQQLQSLHHRFEFAAGNIETRRNYRLDISLRASRGLHRRSKQRMKKIDNTLASRALLHSRKQQEEDIETAKLAVATARMGIDDSIEALLVLQERLNINIGLSDNFLRASVTAELAGERASSAEEQLSNTLSQHDILKQQRIGVLPESKIEFIECGVIRGPTNLGARLQTAGLAGLLTMVALGLSRWRVTRKV